MLPLILYLLSVTIQSLEVVVGGGGRRGIESLVVYLITFRWSFFFFFKSFSPFLLFSNFLCVLRKKKKRWLLKDWDKFVVMYCNSVIWDNSRFLSGNNKGKIKTASGRSVLYFKQHNNHWQATEIITTTS